MTLAEQLRQEVDITKELPWLKEEVVKQIRQRGKFSIICDTHINSADSFSIPYKYWTPIEKWARSEGFSVYGSHNSYGVKRLNIEL
jgi:hypothetical protein